MFLICSVAAAIFFRMVERVPDSNEILAPERDPLFGTVQRQPDARRGRGTASNASGRYEHERRELVDDGWGSLDEEPPPLRTTVTRDTTKTIIARNTAPDIPFDRSINPYRGCEHGCTYCFARPTHAYLGLSPGLDFESRLFVKPGAAELLARELRDPKYLCRPIAMGTNTDPYQPIEREWKITRQILEVLSAFEHPVTIVTKSHLVTRDIDILADMAKRNLAWVGISVTTLDPMLARAMEPRASTPPKRLAALRELHAAGIPTGVMAAPMIPALNDMELERILEAARATGAETAGYVVLRLPLEIKDLWREWLQEKLPDRAAKVMGQIRAMRGGRDYDANWFTRMAGTGEYVVLLRKRFNLAVKRFGFNKRNDDALDTTRFRPPPMAGDQLRLL
jgi:DNA repair photolyase